MFPGRRLHRIWVGERLSGVFSSGVSDLVFFCFGFFIWSQICSLRLVFPWHASFVADFFRSSSLQPQSCPFFTLGAWLTHAREVTPWTGACGSWLVFQGAVGDFSADQRSSNGFLLQRRSPVAMRAAGDDATWRHSPFWLLFRVFYVFFSFLFFSQLASMMLKCYWTICWLTC
jgi:hypothetical protein